MSQKQQERLDQQVNVEDEQESGGMETNSIPTPASPSTPMEEDANRTDAQETPTSEEVQPIAETSQKRRKKRKTKWVSVDDVSPKPSYWPLALTVSISVLLMGVMIHPIVIGVGAILVIISLIGWMLERR